MAHDFSIIAKGVSVEEKNYAYFFGYAEGVMYDVFDMWEHNNFISGDGLDIVIDRETALQGICKAIKKFETLDYPDKTRMDDIKEFYLKMQNEFKDVKEYIICYS